MSAMNSLALDRIDGTHAEAIKDTVDAIQLTPASELPPSVATSTACLSSQQGKVPLRLASCSNSCGVPPQASVKQQQPQTSKKQRLSSTSSVCTTSSKKSCKSTASQIQEVAGDEVCATILLASFAIFLISSFWALLFLLCLSGCHSRLLGLYFDPSSCCYCCKLEGSALEFCYQSDSCTLCALACLFCEFMTVCSLFLECGACRGCLEACCSVEGGEPLSEGCCGEAGGGNCPCGLGCGMLQDCCGSSDCLEICLECCSICFPA